ncbi:MAG: hypothetical protein Q8R13_00200 [bacterium]|nr:hypothetical protein [bacterium]MDZ4296633.1 hypothetical protein [Patescibacteria group bacterium]
MNSSIILILIGLSFNTLASLVMLYPYLNIRRNVDDDFIVDMNKEIGEYTQKKHIKDRKLGMAGFVLFVVGFAFQIIGVVVSI